jgi:hypothetical protein
MRIALLLLLTGCATQLDLTDDMGSTPAGDLAGGGGNNDLGGSQNDLGTSCLSGQPTIGVSCGGTTCSIQNGEPCCFGTSAAGTSSMSCGPGACPPNDNSLSCDGPEDCMGGRVCCYALGMGGVSAATCRMACSGRRVCHSAKDCPNGGVCRHDANFPDGVGLCRTSC